MTQVEAMFERYGPKYRLWVTITILLGLIALGMSITVVNVAIPYIQGVFGMSSTQVQWLSTGFLAATTVTLLITPWLQVAVGMRLTYVGVLVVFVAASLAGGWAAGMGMVIAARIVQGAMTGFIRPVALDALFMVYPPERRGFVTALYGMCLGLPTTLAMVIGGYFVENFSWRYVFFLVVPFCIAAILMGLAFLPDREQDKPIPKLDWVGATVLFVAVFCPLTAISNGQLWGWFSAKVEILWFVTAVCLAFFVCWELRQARPLLDLGIFKSRIFVAGALVMMLFGSGLYGVMYLLPLFMDSILGYNPVTSGLLFTPATAVMAILVPLVGRYADRVPAHWLTLPTLVITVFGILRFAQSDWDTSFHYLAWSMVLMAIGMATVLPPTMARAIGALPGHLLAYGSGAVNFVMQLGGAFGTVFLVVMIERDTARHAATLTQEGLTPGNPIAREALKRYGQIAHHTGTSEVHVHAAATYLLSKIDALWATIYAYQDGFLMIATALVVVMIPSYLMSYWSRHKPAPRAGGSR